MFEKYFDKDSPRYVNRLGFMTDFYSENTKSSRGTVLELIGLVPDLEELVDSKDGYLMTLGCSFTKGEGVPLDKKWPVFLSNMLGLPNLNIARTGWSAAAAVQHAMAHIRKYGKPKYIAFLMPDLLRFHSPINQYSNKISYIPVRRGSYLNFTSFSIARDTTTNVSKYSKKPYPLDEILAPEMAVYQSSTALLNFIDYCDQAEIPLVWSSWHVDTLSFYLDILEKDEVYLGNLIKVSPFFAIHEEIGLPEDCHLEHIEEHGENFYIGSDDGKHSGVHQHLHWAEDFYKKLKEIGK